MDVAGSGPQVLPRRLGAVSAMGALVGIMVGSGIFRVPSTVAAQLPSPGAFMLVWVVGGLFSLAGALAFGELAAMFPDTGGRYVFIREGIGPLAAFLYGWMSTLLLRPASVGAIALVCASYLGVLVPSLAAHERETAGACILLLAAVNYRSVLWSAGLGSVTSAAKFLALGVVAVAILVGVPAAGPAPPAAAIPWHGFLLALVTVMWTYSGWGSTTYITGEMKNSGRGMPLVLSGGVIAITLLYLLVNAAFLHALPMAEIAATKTVAADAAAKVFGAAGGAIIGVMVAVSTFSAANSSLMLSSRLPFAIGRDHPLLGRLSAVHSVHQTPYIGVVVTTLLSLVYLSNHSFEQLAEVFVLGLWPFYGLCVVGLFRLRRLRPDLPRPYRTPGYPVVPALFLLATVAMVGNAAIDRPRQAALGVGILLLGIPVYYGFKRAGRLGAAAPPID